MGVAEGDMLIKIRSEEEVVAEGWMGGKAKDGGIDDQGDG